MSTSHLRAVLAACAVLLVALASGCGSDSSPDSAGTPEAKAPCTYRKDGTEPPKKVDLPPAKPPTAEPGSVTLETSAGDVTITLEPEQAPCAVNSFVSLAEQKFFDGTKCHRVTTKDYFVLQCGDPQGDGTGGPGYTFKDELVPDDPRLAPCSDQGGQQVCTYNTGVVAMANSGPDTNGSQFFLVYGSSQFPPAYTVLGHMDATGLKTVKQVAAAGVGTPSGMNGPYDGAPKVPVTIQRAVVEKPTETPTGGS